MQFTYFLRDLTSKDVMIAGGKGASLGEMIHAGIPVPGGFVVLSDTFDYFLQKTGLDIQIEAILDSVNHKIISSVEEASESIQSLVLSFPMPIEIEKEIYTSFDTEQLEYVAVRSSATAEDGAEHARAGQLDSYLNTTREDLIQKVRKCWASLFTPRAIFYRFEKDLHNDHISVAVVVQKMVQSEMSGIAFSVHPVTEDRNQIIIEAGYGLGEAIVSGAVTPDSYVVRKDTKDIDITVNHQQKALYRSKNGGNEWVDLGSTGRNQILTTHQILELAKIIITIENHYRFPCDIERAYEGGSFFIVQSRPITTLSEEQETNKNNYTKPHYYKAYTRDTSLVLQKAWILAISKLYNTLKGHDYDYPPIIMYLYDGTIEIYDNEEFDKELSTALLLKNQQDANFFHSYVDPFLVEALFFEKLWEKGRVESLDELKDVLERWNKQVEKYVVYYLSQYDNSSPQFILEIGRKIRETDEFFARTDKILRNSLCFLYPNLIGVENAILQEEIGNPPTRNELLSRQTGFVFTGKNNYVKVLRDLPYSFESLPEKSLSIQGQIGFKGKIQGKVFILKRNNDVEKVQDGDIIVSPMTTPEHVIAMKKAAAFVTDEGGITCHAAIIAREMKKPCIIGTRIATQVLKDGDLVEVDADNGVVKILESISKAKKSYHRSNIRDRYIPALRPIYSYWNRDIKNYYSIKHDKLAVHVFQNGHCSVFHEQNMQDELGEHILLFLQENLHDLESIRTRGIQSGQEVIEFTKRFSESLSSSKGTISDYKEFLHSFIDYYVKVMQDNMFYWVMIGNILEKKIKSLLLQYISPDRLDAVYMLLATPHEKSYSQIEEEEFYELVSIYNQYGQTDGLSMKVKEFSDKYFRFPYEYVGPNIWDETTIMKRVKESSHDSHTIDLDMISKQQNNIISEYKLPLELCDLFEIVRYTSLMQDDRKMLMSHTCYYLNGVILKKLSELLDIPHSHMLYIDIDILEQYAGDREYLKEILQQRNQFCVLIQDNINTSVYIDNAAKQKLSELSISLDNEHDGDTIIGQSANKGIVTGKVRILKTSHIDDFEEGTIIVTGMTTPDFVPLMKKAKAIITDEGGITCHAAIISREINIPCIIGTKVASKILKDGDLVEVDADNGVVRILEKEGRLRDIDFFKNIDISYEGGRACYKCMAVLLNTGYIIKDPIVEIPDQFGLISISEGYTTKRYRYIDDTARYDLYLQKVLGGDDLLGRSKETIEAIKNQRFLRMKNLGSLTALDNHELKDLFREYVEYYTHIACQPFIIRMIDRGIIRTVNNYNIEDLDDTLALISIPSQSTSSMLEENAVADLIEVVLQNNYDKNHPTIINMIYDILSRFARISLGYYNEKAKTLSTYQNIISNDPIKRLDEYRHKKSQYQIQQNKRQQRLSTQPNNILQLAEVASKASWLKDYYKFSVNHMQYIAEPLWKEISYRTDYNVEYLKDLLPEEIETLLTSGIINENLIDDRTARSLMYTKDRELYILAGQEALGYWNTINPDKQQINNNSRSGRSACRGVYSGIARIILSPHDFEKVQQGDVLVVMNTSPDFIVLFDKVGAILAEEGGITAHVSVVSREYNIPCVVGLQNITKLLQDGDVVEIDANTGQVKLIDKVDNISVLPAWVIAGEYELVGSRPMIFQRDEMICMCFAKYMGLDWLSVSIDGNNRSMYSNSKQIDIQYEDFFQHIFVDKENWNDHKKNYGEFLSGLQQFHISYSLLSNYSNQELVDYFSKWNTWLLEFGPYVTAPFVVERRVDPFVRDLLVNTYGETLADTYFSIASSPTEYIQYQCMRIDICTMVIDGDIDIQKLVDTYYRYSEYVFTEKLLDEQCFIDEINKLTVDQAKHERDEIVDTITENREKYNTMKGQISHEEVLHRLDIINTYVHLRTDRVDVLKQGQVWIRYFYQTLAERLGRLYEDVLLLTNDEIIFYLEKDIIPSSTIRDQRQPDQYYFFYEHANDSTYVGTDTTSLEKVKGLLDSSGDDKISGLVGYPGRVQGIVKKIYSREDISKIQPGDVLVARHTMIDYTPAMKIAVAFVTDEGGITSHAAIVARELKKPCILGCKHAMKYLEDGDLVEVDADNGVVKILQKNLQYDNIMIEISGASWGKHRAGRWSLISAYYLGYQYTKQLKDQVGIGLEQTLIITKNGISSCYFTQESKDTFGQYFAQQANENPSIIGQRCENFIKASDNALSTITSLFEQEVSKENFEKYIEAMYVYGIPHRIAKVATDYIDSEVLQEYLTQLEHARVYAEPVYEMTEKYMYHVATKLAQQYDIEVSSILAMTRDQFENLLYRSVIPTNIDSLRMQDTAALYMKHGSEYYIFGDDVYDIEKKLISVKTDTFSGQIAFKGKITGKVKLVIDANTIAIEEFEEGSILVTGMTRPEYLPLVQKCSAFITDAGGMLSHAAITARELKKPCIIGTEIATKLLHDGDLIEVDADNGIVKIISSSH